MVRRKTQKGGAVLGQGGFGCVVDPPKMCSNTSSVNKVSKLIKLSDMDEEEYEELKGEFAIAKILRKKDPRGNFYMPGLEECEFVSSEKDPKQLQDDIKKCGFKPKTKLLNIIMNRGEDFMLVGRLNNTNKVKSLGYLLYGAKESIYKNDICLMDVKYLNLLYKLNGKDLHPVFIDFTPGFVIQSRREV